MIAPTPAVQRSLEYCDELSRKAGANFYWGFRPLGVQRRLAMSSLYAFARATDDIVDEGDVSPEQRRQRIARWRADLVTAVEHGQSSQPIFSALIDSIERYDVPVPELLLLVDGCTQDLSKARYQTMDETLVYCRMVAGTVGLSMLPILGGDRGAEPGMLSLANAFQLTNILRDIPEDALRDRIYLPLDDLRAYGVSEADVLGGAGNDPLRRYMAVVAESTKDCYRRSDSMAPHLTPSASHSLAVMRGIYEGILDLIVARECDVWSRRPRLSTYRKIRILLPTLALAWMDTR